MRSLFPSLLACCKRSDLKGHEVNCAPKLSITRALNSHWSAALLSGSLGSLPVGYGLRRTALAILLCGFVAGCSGGSSQGGGTQPQPTISSVSVACAPSSILITQTATCTPTITGTGNYSSSVTWSVSPENVGTISSAGVFTPTAAGTAAITATSTQDTTKSGAGSITAANTTALAISITDLPSGTPGAVTVTDPNGQETQVAASQMIAAIPGTYTVTASSVTAGSSTYIAKLQTQTAQVTSGSPTSVAVDYYDVIPQSTKVLDTSGMESLQISSDGSTLTISSASTVAQSLQAGNVLVVPPLGANSVAPFGLLRKITAVSPGSSVIVVTVQSATLADAFQRLSIGLNSQANSANVQSVRTLSGVVFHPGTTLGPHPLARSISTSNAVQDPCGSSSLGVFDIPESISFDPEVGITLSGQVEVCSGLNFSVDMVGKGLFNLQPQLNSLTATATVGEYSDLSLQGEFLSGSFDPDPIVLGTLVAPTIPVPGLPIWVTPVVTVFAGASGNISAGFSTEASEAGSITGGVNYSSGQWTPVQPTPSLQFSFTPPVIDSSLEAKAYAGVGIDLKVWDLVGPSFKPDGYIEFNADINANPWWTLIGGIEGPMSVDVGFLGENLASYSLGNMFDYSTTIKSASGPFSPSSSSPVIQTLSPAQIAAGSPAFTLGVAGSNFVPGAVVNFGSTPLVTNWQNSGALTAAVPATVVAQAGTIPVTVTNPGTGGGSAAATFTVAPFITISPVLVYVPAGSLQTFTASVASGGSVTWGVEEGASGGSITSAGIYAAPTFTGTYHVIATNTANTSESATATVNVVAGPSIRTLHSFDHSTEGAGPWGGPVFGSDGYLYGTTEAGGDLSCSYIASLAGCGSIYKADTAGNVTTLHQFSGLDGAYPSASLLQTPSGSWYGTTEFGGTNTSDCMAGGTSTFAGCGALFSVDASQNFNVLYSFGPYSAAVGVGPDAALIQAADGSIYGASLVGGSVTCGGSVDGVSEPSCGTIFQLNSLGIPALEHSFSGPDGAYPAAALLQMPDGNFYGTTIGGGDQTCSSYASPGCGTVFQMTASSAVKVLHSFAQQDGAAPDAQLIVGKDGQMYGTTLSGGSTSCSGGASWSGCGTVFKIDTAGNFTPLHSFSGPDGAYPAQLVQASDGYFYGTTESGGDTSCTGPYGPGCGTVFRMDAAGNVTVLYAFTGQSDGSWPESALVQGTDGNLYGTTAYGGTNDDGVIFQISNLAALAATTPRVGTPQVVKPFIAPRQVTRPHIALPRPAQSLQH